MNKLLISFLLMTMAALGQYTAEPAGAPPAELSPEMIGALQPEGHKIVASDGTVFAELWFRNSSADGPETGEMEVSWNTVAHGTMIGALRFPGDGEDRRGIPLEAGVYTLRFSFFPVDGAHQGVEPSRDFLILSPAAIDKDPAANPGFEELMKMSSEATGAPHPGSLACWKGESDWQEGLTQLENDWVLNVKIGETPISIIVKGVNPHG